MKLSRKAKYKLILCLILCVGALSGILFGIRDYVQRRDIETISMNDALSDYDYMWEVLEGNYPFLKMAERKYGLSMDALKTKYRGDIEALGNGGGNDSYWMNSIVAPNIDETLEYISYYLTPYGEESRAQFALDHTGFEDLNPNLDDLLKFPKINPEDLSEVSYYAAISPSVTPTTGEKLCSGQFFLLVDQGVYSAADAFAMFCKATGFATVVGVNTKGDGGGRNVYHLKLPQSGLILRYRAMHGLNPDGSSNVEFGTTPDVVYSGVRGSSEVSVLGLCLDYIKSVEK